MVVQEGGREGQPPAHVLERVEPHQPDVPDRRPQPLAQMLLAAGQLDHRALQPLDRPTVALRDHLQGVVGGAGIGDGRAAQAGGQGKRVRERQQCDRQCGNCQDRQGGVGQMHRKDPPRGASRPRSLR